MSEKNMYHITPSKGMTLEECRVNEMIADSVAEHTHLLGFNQKNSARKATRQT